MLNEYWIKLSYCLPTGSKKSGRKSKHRHPKYDRRFHRRRPLKGRRKEKGRRGRVEGERGRELVRVKQWQTDRQIQTDRQTDRHMETKTYWESEWTKRIHLHIVFAGLNFLFVQEVEKQIMTELFTLWKDEETSRHKLSFYYQLDTCIQRKVLNA